MSPLVRKIASEPDHSLPFVVFAEIERMSFRVETYGEEDKNKKPLLKALQRLEEKLEEAGYERERLLGAYYIQGKTYQARFVPSKDPKHKTPTITRIFRPGIKYEGKLIQAAEVEVSEFQD